MTIVEGYTLEPIVGDPDDRRPATRWAVLTDPPGGVEEGAVVFIPADVPHGTLNTGNEPVRIFAVYPSTTVGLRYLERDPAPGTEADQPQPPVTLDLRTGEVATTP